MEFRWNEYREQKLCGYVLPDIVYKKKPFITSTFTEEKKINEWDM